MRPLLAERKGNCGLSEAVKTAFGLSRGAITGLKAGVNEKPLSVGQLSLH
jgi:hypothetical protein